MLVLLGVVDGCLVGARRRPRRTGGLLLGLRALIGAARGLALDPGARDAAGGLRLVLGRRPVVVVLLRLGQEVARIEARARRGELPVLELLLGLDVLDAPLLRKGRRAAAARGHRREEREHGEQGETARHGGGAYRPRAGPPRAG